MGKGVGIRARGVGKNLKNFNDRGGRLFGTRKYFNYQG